MSEIKINTLLGGKVKICQNETGFKVSSDAVFLQSQFEFYKKYDANGRRQIEVLDVGAGNGAISLMLAYRFKNLHITGIEIQKTLYQLANKSKKINGFDDRVTFINDDILNLKKHFNYAFFDYVITNPPFYKDKGFKSIHEDKAKAHTISDISIKEWVEISVKFIKVHGGILLIVKPDELTSVLTAFDKMSIGNVEILPLIPKAKSELAERLIIKGQRGSKGTLKLRQALILHNDNDSYTKEAERLLRNFE